MINLKSLWSRISNLGILPDQRHQLAKSVRLTNRAAFLVIVLSLSYFILELIFFRPQREIQPPFYGMQVALIVVSVVVLVLNSYRLNLISRLLFCIAMPFMLLPNAYALNQPLRSEFYMYGFAASTFLLFPQRKLVSLLFVVPVIVFYLMVFNLKKHFPDLYALDGGTLVRIGISFSYIFIVMNLLRSENIRYESELEELNKTKDKVLSIVSHDLRGPVGSLRTLLQMFDKSQISQEEFQQLIRKLYSKVGSLHDTLDNLLHWSYAQSNGMKVKPEVFSINKLINEIIQLLLLNAESKGISIVAPEDRDVKIFADVTMTRSILINLISNAIKFTPAGGSIKISVEPDKLDTVSVAIQDNGRGMTQDMIDSLFTSDRNFSMAGTDNEPGTGLGLQLCKEFIEKNNGKISVKSELGKGSEFRFTFPSRQNL